MTLSSFIFFNFHFCFTYLYLEFTEKVPYSINFDKMVIAELRSVIINTFMVVVIIDKLVREEVIIHKLVKELHILVVVIINILVVVIINRLVKEVHILVVVECILAVDIIQAILNILAITDTFYYI